MRPAVRLHFQDLAPALALAFATVACSGVVGGGTTPGAGGSSSTGAAGSSGSGTAGAGSGTGAGPGAGGSVSTTGVAGNTGVQATCPTTAITPTPLRRLTKFEYANTTKNLAVSRTLFHRALPPLDYETSPYMLMRDLAEQ